MAIVYVGTGAWSEVFTSGPVAVNIPAHLAGDHATLVVAALTTGMAAPAGWTLVGTEYVEGVLFWTVFERILPTTEAGTTTENVAFPGTAGAGALVSVLRGAGVGSALVFQDDNTSDAFGVIPTITAPGFYLNFTAIYAARTTFGSTPKVTLQSGTATGTVAEQSFQSVLTGGYRMAVATLDLSAASSAIYVQRWAGGNTNSNALRVAVFEPSVAAASGTVTITSMAAGAVTKRVPASGTVVAVTTVTGAGVKLTAPPIPGSLTGTPAAGAVALTWDAAARATSYEIAYRTTVGGSNQFATTTATARTITGLTGGVEYWFKVRAINSAGSSAYTDAVFVTPAAGATGAGTVAVISTVAGAVTKRVRASGTVAAVSTVAGAVTKRVRASGTVAAVSTVAGAVTTTGPVPHVPGTPITERELLERVRVETYNTFTNPFTLSRSRLDYAELGGPASVGVWTNWIGQVISVTSRRGGTRDGLTIRNAPGLLTVAIRDLVIDPGAPEMLPDQPFRLVLDLAGATHTLFTGKLRDMRTEYRLLRAGKPPVPVTMIVAVDAVADHDAVTRYGAIPATGAEAFPDRIRRLAQTATAPLAVPTFTDWRGTPAEPLLLGRTVFESSVSNHLTLACNTVRAMWWVDPDGVTRFQPRVWDEGSAIEFVSAPFINRTPNPLHHLDHVLENGTQALFNIEVARNLDAVDNGDGGWEALETLTELNIPAPSTVPAGRHRVTIDTNAANVIDLLDQPEPAGMWLTAYRRMTDKPASLRWNAQEDLTRIPDLEIGRCVMFGLPGVHAAAEGNHIIIGVAHTITPTRWITELTLIGA